MNMPNMQNDRHVVYAAAIRITRTVARWIVTHGRDLLEDGYNPETDTGFLNDIPIDTETYRYIQELYRLVQTVVGILQRELDIEDEMVENRNPLQDLNNNQE